jgi:hypothetical protein
VCRSRRSLFDYHSVDYKDIPEAACNDRPFSFFACFGANLLGKVADEIASARL